MSVVSKDDALAFGRDDGLVSQLMRSRRNVDETDLPITWVDVESGAAQVRHEHDPEQVYPISATIGFFRRPRETVAWIRSTRDG